MRLRLAAATGHAVEGDLGRLAFDHQVRDLVGVLLVPVTLLADAAGKLYAAALLDHVGGLVCCGVKTGLALERDLIAPGEAVGADRLVGLPGGRVGVRVNAADVVAAERLLDLVPVGQRLGLARGAVLGCSLDRYAVIGRRLGRQLHGGQMIGNLRPRQLGDLGPIQRLGLLGRLDVRIGQAARLLPIAPPVEHSPENNR